MSEKQSLSYGPVPTVDPANINYKIVLSNNDGIIDIGELDFDTSTSLDLFGRKSTQYGKGFWANLVHLLENFNSTKEPRNPIVGQLWYNGTDLKICTSKTTKGKLVSENTYSNAIGTSVDDLSDATWKTVNISDGLKTEIDADFVKSRILVQPDNPKTYVTDEKGIIWYESDTNQIRINTGSNNWVAFNNIVVSNSAPTSDKDQIGQLWLDTKNGDNILKIQNVKGNWFEINPKSKTTSIPLASTDPTELGSLVFDTTSKQLKYKYGSAAIDIFKVSDSSTSLTIPTALPSTQTIGNVKYDSVEGGSLEIAVSATKTQKFYGLDITKGTTATTPSVIQPQIITPVNASSFCTGRSFFDTATDTLLIKSVGDKFVKITDTSKTLKIPTTIPATPQVGHFYYDPTKGLQYYDDTNTWINPLNIAGVSKFVVPAGAVAENYVLKIDKDKNATWGLSSGGASSLPVTALGSAPGDVLTIDTLAPTTTYKWSKPIGGSSSALPTTSGKHVGDVLSITNTTTPTYDWITPSAGTTNIDGVSTFNTTTKTMGMVLTLETDTNKAIWKTPSGGSTQLTGIATVTAPTSSNLVLTSDSTTTASWKTFPIGGLPPHTNANAGNILTIVKSGATYVAEWREWGSTLKVSYATTTFNTLVEFVFMKLGSNSNNVITCEKLPSTGTTKHTVLIDKAVTFSFTNVRLFISGIIESLTTNQTSNYKFPDLSYLEIITMTDTTNTTYIINSSHPPTVVA